MTTSDAIVVERLTKRVRVGFLGRPKTLLDGVDLRLGVGRTLGFVGKNGAGKSTTIRHLIGGARPTSGSVRVLGGSPLDASVRQRLGFMPELPWLPPTLTPTEMVSLHAALCGVPAAAGMTLLERVDLAAHARARVGTFSKGMQTRLCLGLALLHDPELLVLDEPMSGLDPVGRDMVRRVLREESARGRSIVFSSHVLADVEALCDDVVVIDRGRTVYAGSTTEAVGEVGDLWTVRARPIAASPTPPEIAGAAAPPVREGDTWLLRLRAPDAADAARRAEAASLRVLSVAIHRRSLEERVLELVSGAGGAA